MWRGRSAAGLVLLHAAVLAVGLLTLDEEAAVGVVRVRARRRWAQLQRLDGHDVRVRQDLADAVEIGGIDPVGGRALHRHQVVGDRQLAPEVGPVGDEAGMDGRRPDGGCCHDADGTHDGTRSGP